MSFMCFVRYSNALIALQRIDFGAQSVRFGWKGGVIFPWQRKELLFSVDINVHNKLTFLTAKIKWILLQQRVSLPPSYHHHTINIIIVITPRCAESFNSELEKRITDAFSIFDHHGNKTVDVREVGSIVRYLGKYSSYKWLLFDNPEHNRHEQVASQLRLKSTKSYRPPSSKTRTAPYICRVSFLM